MRNRLVSGAALTVVILALSATTVFAAFAWQASGGGQSNQGASYGFNVKSDMTGHLNYVGVTSLPVTVNSVAIPAGSSFHGSCHNYTKVQLYSPTQARMWAQCRGFFFVNGGPPVRGTVYVQAHVVDNGEPGVNDRACFVWGLTPGPHHGQPGVFVNHCGQIQSGNIQVKSS